MRSSINAPRHNHPKKIDQFIQTELVADLRFSGKPLKFIGRSSKEKDSIEVVWGRDQCEFGDCFVAATDLGVCWLDIAPSERSLEELATVWQSAIFRRDDAVAQQLLGRMTDHPVTVHACGTEFQLEVWSALPRIRSGQVMTYAQLAACLGRPRSARAVGGAVAANGIALLLPCHRVVPASGASGAYRWGPALKQDLLARERANRVLAA